MAGSAYGIYGASGCGRGIMPLARRHLAQMAGSPQKLVFIDDAPTQTEINGHLIVTFDEFLALPCNGERYAALAIADGRIRQRLYNRCTSAGVAIWSIIADNTVMFDDVVIGRGALLSPFVTITSNIRIGLCFHANLYSYVEHDSVVGDFVTFAPGVQCNGNVHIDDYAYIGAGAILKQGRPGNPLTIGQGAIVGMGAVVTCSVAPGVTVVGNPARPIVRTDQC